MGASAWSYFVPFRDDVNEALQALRWEVFRAGDYAKPPTAKVPTLEEFTPDDPGIWDVEEELEMWKEMHAQAVKRLRKAPPKSPDALLKRCAEDGTHSIIDIREITDSEKKSVSGMMKRKDRVRLFGTDQPTHAQLEAQSSDVTGYRRRGLCTVVVVVEDGRPTELFFAGTSGD